ncbi:MAG: hypothetical protein Q8M37_11235 [Nevskia sp.]|nr:hypothetical protein [Nevskia sp.]
MASEAIDRPHLLFAPYYKWGGSSEFVRAVALANAAQKRWPTATIEFLLPGGAETRHDCPFPVAFNEAHLDKPSRVSFLNREISERRPHLVIFDCYSHPAVLDQCRAVGARSAYVADQPGTCKRAFEWPWLWRLDAHWQQRPYLTSLAFTPGQRLLSAISSTRRAIFDTYFDDLPSDLGELPPEIRARAAQPFALLVPGGGGYRVDGRYVGDIFHAAAEQLHTATGLDAITLLGPLHQGPIPEGQTLAIKALNLPQLLALMRRARIIVTNGATGSLHQALACGAACVASPLGGSDQPERIRRYARAGLLLAAAPEAAALAKAAERLLTAEGDPIHQRVSALKPVNGISLMIRLIEEQLQLRADRSVSKASSAG